jgi:hypothetical protein
MQEAALALGRGRQVEQFLGFGTRDDVPTVRWLSASRSGRSFVVRFHEAADDGDDEFVDLSEFRPLDPDEEPGEGRVVMRADDAGELLANADGVDADPNLWVNFGVVQDEYRDARRSA